MIVENENNVNRNMKNHVKYDEENNNNYVSIGENIIVNENRNDEENDNRYKEIKNIKNSSNIFVVNLEAQKEELNYNKNSELKLSMVQQIRLIIQEINTLNSNRKNKLEYLLVKHKNIFSDKPGCINSYVHKITLNSSKPFVKRSYPIPIKYRTAVEEEINNMIRDGIIERSVSPYCNPLRVMNKKDGNIRLCLDARFLNEYIVADNESPPIIKELFQKFAGVKYFTTTDLSCGYW